MQPGTSGTTTCQGTTLIDPPNGDIIAVQKNTSPITLWTLIDDGNTYQYYIWYQWISQSSFSGTWPASSCFNTSQPNVTCQGFTNWEYIQTSGNSCSSPIFPSVITPNTFQKGGGNQYLVVYINWINGGNNYADSAIYQYALQPTINATGGLHPTSAPAGSSFQLTVNGTGFDSSSLIQGFEGGTITPDRTRSTSTQLFATIPKQNTQLTLSITVTNPDELGSNTSSPGVAFTIGPPDTTPPTITSVTPAPGKYLGNGNTITVVADDQTPPGDQFTICYTRTSASGKCESDAAPSCFSPGSGTQTQTFQLFTDCMDTYHVTITATDQSNNVTTWGPNDYTLQFAPPTLITVPTQDQTNTTTTSFTVSGTGNAINIAVPHYLGLNYNSTSQDIDISTLQGNNPFNVTVSNLAPNTSYSSISGAFGAVTPVSGDPSASTYANSTPQNVTAWTLPLAAVSAPTLTSPAAGSLQGTFVFPANPSGTTYTLQISKDGFQTVQESKCLTPPTDPPTYTFTNLDPGQYTAKVRTLSGSDGGCVPNSSSLLLDVFSPPSGQITIQFLPPNPLFIDPTPADYTFQSFSLIVGNPNTSQSQPTGLNVNMTCVDANGLPTTGQTTSNHSFSPGQPPAPVSINSNVAPVGNSSCTAITAQFTDSNSPPNTSPFTALAGTVWVNPFPVQAFSLTPVGTNTSISEGFTFSPNVPGTNYQLEASADGNFDDTVTGPPVAQYPGATGLQGTLTVPVAGNGLTYALRIRVVSNATPSPSVWDALTSVGSATTNINPGTLVPPPTATTITAQWSFNPSQSVTQLQIGATNYLGTSVGTTPNPLLPPFSNPEKLTIDLSQNNSLAPSNTSYTLVLQYTDSTGLHTYAGSQVSGTPMTLAGVPSAPILTDGGNVNTGLNFAVGIGPDTNATDSLYALYVIPPTGQPGYLQGTANGTAVSALSSSIVWLTSAAWTTGGTNLVTGIAVNSTYQAQVYVQQKYDGTSLGSAVSSIGSPGTVLVTSYTVNGGLSLDNALFGVPTNSPVQVNFNVPIDPNSLAGKITVLQGLPPNQVTLTNITTTYAIINGVPTLSIGGNWLPNMDYTVSLAPGIADLFGFQTTQTNTLSFLTAPNIGVVSNIVSPQDSTQSAVVQLPVNGLPAGGFIVPRVQTSNPPHSLTDPSITNLSFGPQGAIQPLSNNGVELLIYPSNGGLGTSQAGLTLTLKVSASKTNLLNEIDKSTLGIYTVNSQGAYVMVPGATLNADGSMSLSNITQSGIYLLAGAISTQLSGAYAYPVPYKPALGHTVINFANLAVDSTIKIYTIMGELVAQPDMSTAVAGPNGLTVTWDVKNKSGDNVASGVYIYQIKNAYSEKRGKLVIIR
jgi:hypothetical protein